MRRGRPAYPDVLTPREWEVLALIKEGLTNPQIAQRLGISEHGARFHVSEILSKLGVESRREAAEWRPARKPFALFGLLMKAGVAAAVVAGVIALMLLGIGVLAMNSRASSDADSLAAPTSTQEPEAAVPAGTQTGISEIDRITQAVLDRDAQALTALFKFQEVACTNASGLGGPPNCGDTKDGSRLAEGTAVRVFPSSSCELGWASDIGVLVENLLSRSVKLYGVVEFTAPLWSELYLPRSSYGIILEAEVPNSPRIGVVLHVENGGIVYFHRLCTGLPEFVLRNNDPRYGGKVNLVLKGPAFQ